MEKPHRFHALVESLIAVQSLARALDRGDECVLPTQILDRVWLGSALQAISPFVLNSLLITHIVDATGMTVSPWKQAKVGMVAEELLAREHKRMTASAPQTDGSADAAMNADDEWNMNHAKEIARQIVHGNKFMSLPRTQSQALLSTFKQSTGKCIQFLCLAGLRDQTDADILSWFENVNVFIDTALQDPTAHVLVHCQAGVSRSPSLLVAFLTARHEMTLDAAYAFVQHRRPVIRPNPGFLAQLIEYQDILHRDESGSIKTRGRLADSQPILLAD